MPKMNKEETIALVRRRAMCKCPLEASLAYQQSQPFSETIDPELDRLRRRAIDLSIELTKVSLETALYCEKKLEGKLF